MKQFKDALTVKELIKDLRHGIETKEIDPNAIVILSHDEEGNGYSTVVKGYYLSLDAKGTVALYPGEDVSEEYWELCEQNIKKEKENDV